MKRQHVLKVPGENETRKRRWGRAKSAHSTPTLDGCYFYIPNPCGVSCLWGHSFLSQVGLGQLDGPTPFKAILDMDFTIFLFLEKVSFFKV
jgi:hypothetical protein